MQNEFIKKFSELAPINGQKFGIQNCRDIIAYSGEAVTNFSQALADGKISFFEGVGLTPTIIKGARLLVNIKLIGQEIADLDQQEKDELIAQLKELPVFRSQSSQQILDYISTATDALLHIYQAVNACVDLAKMLNR